MPTATSRLNLDPRWPFWVKATPAAPVTGPASFVVTADDSITFAESADRTAQSFARPLPTDSLTFSEAVARTTHVAKTATDSVTFAESNTAAAGKTRTVTDAVSFAENLARTALAFTRTSTDTVTFAEN